MRPLLLLAAGLAASVALAAPARAGDCPPAAAATEKPCVPVPPPCPALELPCQS